MKYPVFVLVKIALVLSIIHPSCESGQPVKNRKVISTNSEKRDFSVNSATTKPVFDPVLDSLLYEVIEATGIDWLEGCTYFEGFDSTNTIVHSISPFMDETCYVVEFSGLCGQGNCGANVYAFRQTADTTEILLDACGWIDSISPVLNNGLMDIVIEKRTYNDPSVSGLSLCKFNGRKYERTEIPLERTLEEKIAEFLIETIPKFENFPTRHFAQNINCVEVDLGITSGISYLIYSDFTSFPILVTSPQIDRFQLINNFDELGLSIAVGPNIVGTKTDGAVDLCFYELEYNGYRKHVWRWNGKKYVRT